MVIIMYIFNLSNLAVNNKGEYVLGLDDLKTHAVYMIYGFLEPGDKDRKLLPGKGHEEILFITKGKVLVRTPDKTFELREGQAVHLKEDDEWYLENTGIERAIMSCQEGTLQRSIDVHFS